MGQEEIRFELFPSRDWLGRKRWYWRVRDTGNHQKLCSSEGYVRRIDAHKAAAKVQRYAAIADIAEAVR
jgi:uncharacterized protein YegP (UPF0339 family)